MLVFNLLDEESSDTVNATDPYAFAHYSSPAYSAGNATDRESQVAGLESQTERLHVVVMLLGGSEYNLVCMRKSHREVESGDPSVSAAHGFQTSWMLYSLLGALTVALFL